MFMSPITTHVLDTARGRPAAGVAVTLEIRRADGSWAELGRGVTNADGRITTLLSDKDRLAKETYRLRFATAAYFTALGVSGFFPEVQIHFQIDDPAAHYHVPLLLSPFGYSTYRGS
jgi:5-hydroxyisourate hydrolase